MVIINTDEYFNTRAEKAEFLLDKLIKKEQEIIDEPKMILAKYPKLSYDKFAKDVLLEKAREDLKRIRPYTNLVKDYYFAQSERDFPSDLDFIDKAETELSEVEQ